MKSRFIDQLTGSKSYQDMRKSLNPLYRKSDAQGPRITKFIRDRDSFRSNLVANDAMLYLKKQVNFNPLIETDQKEPLSIIIKKYHDPSFIYKKNPLRLQEKIIGYWSSLISYMLFEQGKQRIFQKRSFPLLIWNFVVMFAYLFNIFQIPVAIFFTEIVYEDQYNTTAGLVINWFTIVTIFLNIIIVRPNSQFQKLGYIINKRTQIIENYIYRYFFIDIIGLLILVIYASASVSQLVYLKLLFYFEIVTVFDIDDMILEKLELKSNKYAFYRLLRLLTYMLFILTWLSSIFFYIDYTLYLNKKYPVQQNWLTYTLCTMSVDSSGNLNGTDIITTYPQQWYIWLNYAVYWSLQTISTVGYGDITPRNPISVVFTNISILIMMFFFVFFINSIIEIIDQTTSSQQKQKVDNIKKFKLYYIKAKEKFNEISLKYNYSSQTIEKNKKYMEHTANNIRNFLYEMDISNLLDDQDNIQELVNQSLTPELREELFLNYRQLFFKKIFFFGQMSRISPRFMDVYQQLIFKIKQVPFGTGEVIYARGQYKSNALYYLLKGSITLTYPLSRYSNLITYLDEDQIDQFQDYNEVKKIFFNFGVREFFTRQPKHHNVITQSYCKIQMLEYSDFIETIKSHKQFYIKFCQLRDIMVIDGSNVYSGQECFQCKSKKHHLFQCSKCLFNISLRVRFQLSNMNRASKVQNYPVNNGRVPFYMRDCIRSQKVKANNPSRKEIYKYQEISNFKQYRPSRNLNIEYFS